MSPEMTKNLSVVCAEIEKKYGKGAIMRLTDQPEIQADDIISSGSIQLDVALGIGGYKKGRIVEIIGPESTGKAQPLSSKILTPIGWKKMGEIEVGSIISTPDGEDSTVLAIFPQGEQQVYKISFDDKTSTFCTLDHLWFVNTRTSELGEVLTTKELLENGLKTESNCRKYKIPYVCPIKFEEQNPLPINPYLLGLLLGDGSFVDNCIKFTTMDEELLLYIKEILDKEYSELILSEKMGKCTYNIRKRTKGHSKTELWRTIKKLGLIGKHSEEKFIPQQYLFASIENRISLLQGLIDTDGSIDDKGSISFSTSSKILSEQFEELVRSLGFRCLTSKRFTKFTTASGEKADGLPSYRSSLLGTDPQIIPAKLSRKRNNFSTNLSDYRFRFIEKIEYDHNEECQCIMIGHPDQLYITDEFIVTHNSTLCLHAVVQAQKQGKTCAYIDAEQSLDKNYALALGVRLDGLLIIQPDNGEQALDIADMLVRSNEIELIVIDSVAALVPKSELEGEIGDFSVGAQARLMSQACRMLVGVCNKTGCTIIFTNQIRYKIGVKFGNPETTSGGNALKFYASTRIDLRRTGDTKVKEEIVGIDVKAKIIKNKCAPPKREAEFSISYGKGINRDQELLNLAIGDQLIEKAGAWFKYNGDTIAQGEASALVWLKENPTIKDEIFKQVMELRGLA